MLKNTIAILVALIITLATAYLQRVTGPTYPLKESIEINDNLYEFKLNRSSGPENMKVDIPAEVCKYNPILYFKRYKIDTNWETRYFMHADSACMAFLPMQPPAGKIEYKIKVTDKLNDVQIPKDRAVIVRFKGEVPGIFLIPHIIFVFMAMFFSNWTGLHCLMINKTDERLIWLTVISLFIGGLLFGPVVQKYAFGELWTGIPKGWDLTDNKTIIAFIIWILALIHNRITMKKRIVLLASLVMLIIFSIPHSLLGSELDYETGQVTTGFITNICDFFCK